MCLADSDGILAPPARLFCVSHKLASGGLEGSKCQRHPKSHFGVPIVPRLPKLPLHIGAAPGPGPSEQSPLFGGELQSSLFRGSCDAPDFKIGGRAQETTKFPTSWEELVSSAWPGRALKSTSTPKLAALARKPRFLKRNSLVQLAWIPARASSPNNF